MARFKGIKDFSKEKKELILKKIQAFFVIKYI